MLPLAHVGIGRRLVARWSADLPAWPLAFGLLLPDVIDKPAYALACLMTGQIGADAGFISGTRTFGHTLLLAGLVALAGRGFASSALKAISLGMFAHLALDLISDACFALLYTGSDGHLAYWERQGIVAILWPLLGFHFPGSAVTMSIQGLAATSFKWPNLCWEVVGAALLMAEARRKT